MSSTTCPIFKPTWEEFKDFYSYIQHIETVLEEQQLDVGIVKVIPPPEWYIDIKMDPLNFQLKELDLTVPQPIKQIVTGRAGVFQMTLLEQKEMNMIDFDNFCSKNQCIDTLEEIERKYWKSLGTSSTWEPAIYGADMNGSIFGSYCNSSWNVDKLDSILSLLEKKVPGVNAAMLYVGTWRASFAFHTEDMNLHSINYLHGGAPKSWYSLGLSQKKRFENLANGYYSSDVLECSEYLRHKTCVISPQKLKEQGMDYTTAVQYPGEFIITFPSCYHQGFNHGFNLAEAVNFATPKWFPFGHDAKSCICRPHSVILNVDSLETLFYRQIIEEGTSRYLQKQKFDEVILNERFWCYCNEINDMKANKSLAEWYTCIKCLRTCHTACMLNLDETLKDLKLCDSCHNLDIIKRRKNTLKSPKSVLSPILFSSPTPVEEITKLPPNSKKSLNTKKRKIALLKIGSLVSITLENSETPLIGHLVDIEDDYGRFHEKASKKQHDLWIPLEDMVLMSSNDDHIVKTSLSKDLLHEAKTSNGSTKSKKKQRNIK